MCKDMNYSWSHVTSYFRVKETKRQGRIAHHHTDATVPHIVALLSFSFHAAKVRQVSEFCKRLGEKFIKKGAKESGTSTPIEEWQRKMFHNACDYIYNTYK